MPEIRFFLRNIQSINDSMSKTSFLKLASAAWMSLFFLSSCNNQSDGNTGKIDSTARVNNDGTGTDTLPDTPQFVFSIDDKEFSVSEEKVIVNYIGRDSTIFLFAEIGDTAGLYMAIPRASQGRFTVPSGYNAEITREPYSDKFTLLPTVVLSNYPEVDISFNNLDDGVYQKKEPPPNAITVTGFRQLGAGSNMRSRRYLLKGYIHTNLFKTAFAGDNKEYNHDYEVKGKFVVQFKAPF